MRKFIAFCLVMVMLFCLCACGHKADMTDDERSSFQFFCNKMKDPTSIILYGDIIAIKTEKGATIQFQYNAKNSYGGYVGNTMGQVHMVAGDMLFLDEEDADFVDISDFTKPSYAEFMDKHNVEVHIISGEDVANEFGVEWMPLS